MCGVSWSKHGPRKGTSKLEIESLVPTDGNGKLMTQMIKVMTWPKNSPDLNLIECLWNVLDKQIQTMVASHCNLQHFKNF